METLLEERGRRTEAKDSAGGELDEFGGERGR